MRLRESVSAWLIMLLFISFTGNAFASGGGGGGGGGGGCSPSDAYGSPTSLSLGAYTFDNSGCSTPCACLSSDCNGTGYSYDICDQASSSGGYAQNGDCEATIMGPTCSIGGCFCGSAENTAWAQFCPTTTGPYTFSLSSITCTGGGASLQFGIYAAGAGCGGSMLTCQGALTGSYSNTQNLTAGQCYTIVFDGNAGAQCTWNLTVTTILPVDLVSFTGTSDENGNILNWTTASEINNKGFEIETCEDGKSFTPISFVEGHGNANQLIEYSFVHKNPAPVNYYRLKQMDNDGAFTFSDVILVRNEKMHEISVIGSDPAGNIRLHRVNGTADLDIRVINLSGQQVFEKQYPAGLSGTISVPSHNLSPGQYFIIAIENGKQTILKAIRP